MAARKTLAERAQDLERKKAALQQREAILATQSRKIHNLAVFNAGKLIEKAGLLGQPENVLLGGLMEMAELAKDPAKAQQWEQRVRQKSA